MYCAIPFAAAWGIGLRRQPYRALVVALLLGFIIIGLALTQSRAGLMLSVIAGLFCIPMFLANGSSKGFSRGRLLGVVIGGGLIALLIAFQFGFVSLAQRVQSDDDIMEDLRWPVASVTLKAAQANLPFGTGFGTFVPVYQTVEPRTLLLERYVNRAHNDWLELGLEGGVLTIVGLRRLFCMVWSFKLSGMAPRSERCGCLRHGFGSRRLHSCRTPPAAFDCRLSVTHHGDDGRFRVGLCSLDRSDLGFEIDTR